MTQKATDKQSKEGSVLAGGAWGPLEIGEVSVEPGTRARINMPMSRLPTGTEMGLPVIIVRGSSPGPSVWLSAALHGDELNGIGENVEAGSQDQAGGGGETIGSSPDRGGSQYRGAAKVVEIVRGLREVEVGKA